MSVEHVSLHQQIAPFIDLFIFISVLFFLLKDKIVEACRSNYQKYQDNRKRIDDLWQNANLQKMNYSEKIEGLGHQFVAETEILREKVKLLEKDIKNEVSLLKIRLKENTKDELKSLRQSFVEKLANTVIGEVKTDLYLAIHLDKSKAEKIDKQLSEKIQ